MACTIEQESPSFHPPPPLSLSLSVVLLFPLSLSLSVSISFLLLASGNLCLPGARCNISTYILRGYRLTQSLFTSLGPPCLIRLFDHASSAFFHTSFVRQGDVDRLLSISRISYPFLLSTRACLSLSFFYFSFFFFFHSYVHSTIESSIEEREREIIIYTVDILAIFLHSFPLSLSLSWRRFSCPVRYCVLWQFAVPLLFYFFNVAS